MNTLGIARACGDGVAVHGVDGKIGSCFEYADAVRRVIAHAPGLTLNNKRTGVDTGSVHVMTKLHEDCAIGPDEIVLRGGDHDWRAAVHDHRNARVLKCDGGRRSAASASGCDQKCGECEGKERETQLHGFLPWALGSVSVLASRKLEQSSWMDVVMTK